MQSPTFSQALQKVSRVAWNCWASFRRSRSAGSFRSKSAATGTEPSAWRLACRRPGNGCGRSCSVRKIIARPTWPAAAATAGSTRQVTASDYRRDARDVSAPFHAETAQRPGKDIGVRRETREVQSIELSPPLAENLFEPPSGAHSQVMGQAAGQAFAARPAAQPSEREGRPRPRASKLKLHRHARRCAERAPLTRVGGRRQFGHRIQAAAAARPVLLAAVGRPFLPLTHRPTPTAALAACAPARRPVRAYARQPAAARSRTPAASRPSADRAAARVAGACLGYSPGPENRGYGGAGGPLRRCSTWARMLAIALRMCAFPPASDSARSSQRRAVSYSPSSA